MKKPQRMNRRQPPGPDYQFTLDDLQRMVEQMGARFQCQIYPREMDADRIELERLRQQVAASEKPEPAID